MNSELGTAVRKDLFEQAQFSFEIITSYDIVIADLLDVKKNIL